MLCDMSLKYVPFKMITRKNNMEFLQTEKMLKNNNIKFGFMQYLTCNKIKRKIKIKQQIINFDQMPYHLSNYGICKV